MKIKSIEFKNFASYGNRVQRITFDDNVGNLYQITGNNGAGKSSLAKAITYLCYGRVEGANIKDLPNRVNGSLWGRIILESKGSLVEVERGISPNIFTVKINGSEYDIAGKANLQEFLDTEIYDISYHVFKNVIILSVNDFKSFITMSPHDKKQIIDRIFGFSAINQMRELVKTKRREISDDIRSFEKEIITLNESIQSVQSKLSEFEKMSNDKTSVEVTSLKNRLIQLDTDKKKLAAANEKIKARILKCTTDAKGASVEEQAILTDIGVHKRALKLYDNQACPTCGSDLMSGIHVTLKEEHEQALLSLEESHAQVKSRLKEADDCLADAREKNRAIVTKVSQLDAVMQQIKEELVKMSNGKGQDSSHLKELIKDFSDKKALSAHHKNAVESEDHYLSLLETIVGEDGVKNLAVKSILPSLNNHVMIMGKEMGIPFGITFDDKFNCMLHHLGEEISPKTLSTGEKKKVDFVIIMALIKMIKTRFPGLNILFLDEIFSSIDSDGVYHIISILHQTIKEIGLNTFVINHTVLPSEYFDKRLEITKDSGFSEFTIEDIG
jgi:DNA repair exonuclease SbcCD ATPase subunit